ncbi:MAG: carboxypeptidase regulatory-like domain-containing protein, partial [Treponema sp.]
MRKVVKLISMLCVLSTFIIGCQNINSQTEDTSAVSLEMPKALFQSVSTNAKVTEYTIIGTISNADSEAKIETVTQTRNSDEDSTTLSFSPITVQTPIILSIEIYAEKQLYMSGSSARHAVTEGKQALDITLKKADGYVEKGSGIITGVAKYTNSTDQSNITIFIQKEDEVISTDTASSSFVPLQSIARYAPTSASASTFTVVSVCSAVKADKDGNYSFTNLDAGTYSIYAASQNSTKASYDTVAVTDGKTSTVNLDLTATGSISGTVLLDGNTTGNSGIFVYVKGTSFIATTNDDGTFTISNVPVSTTAYTLHAKYGTTDKTFTVNETAAAPVVTSGATADAGTMTFTTLEDKHYLSSSTTATDGTVTTTATANYVQATSAGLKFVLTEIPDNTTVVQFYVTNSDGHTTTYSIDTMDSSNNYESTEITDDLVFIFKLVNKGDTYTSAKTYFYKKGWTNSSLVSTTESIISIGGLGEITASSKSITYDQTSNTVTIDKPVYNYDNFNGTVYSKYSEFNVVTSAGVSKSLSIPSSNSINLFTDFGSSSIEAISGQTGSTFKTIYSVRLPEDNVIATNNWSYNYGIYANKLAAQDINTFTPILTAYANGGQVRSITTDA